MGRPERQLKDVEVPLLYVGFGCRATCWAAMRLRSVVLLLGFFGSGGGKSGGNWRPEAEWVDMADA